MTFKTRKSLYTISIAPTGRAHCRKCKRQVGKGELRIDDRIRHTPHWRGFVDGAGRLATRARARQLVGLVELARAQPEVRRRRVQPFDKVHRTLMGALTHVQCRRDLLVADGHGEVGS